MPSLGFLVCPPPLKNSVFPCCESEPKVLLCWLPKRRTVCAVFVWRGGITNIPTHVSNEMLVVCLLISISFFSSSFLHNSCLLDRLTIANLHTVCSFCVQQCHFDNFFLDATIFFWLPRRAISQIAKENENYRENHFDQKTNFEQSKCRWFSLCFCHTVVL